MMRSLRLCPPFTPLFGSLFVLLAVGCGGKAVEEVGDARGSNTGGRTSTGATGGADGDGGTGTATGGTGGTVEQCQTRDDCPQPAPTCTTYRCEEGSCVQKDAADDGDPCTDDFCTVQGISHVDIADDGNACTLDLCDEQGNVSHTWLGDDGDPCTDDACDPALGATHVPTNVDDGDACTADSCDSLLGVRHEPIDVDDGNACTIDECDSVKGPTYAPVTCVANGCGQAVCDPALGCVTTPGSTCCNNLALSAAPTMSAGGVDGAGSYGPGQLNNAVTQTDTCQKYAWIENGSTPSGLNMAPYFQYTWQSPVTIESMYIDTLSAKGEACNTSLGRNLKGAKVQYWTGSSWVTSTTFDNRSNDFTLTLPNPVTTTAIRLYDVTSGATVGNTVVFEWYVFPIAGCSP